MSDVKKKKCKATIKTGKIERPSRIVPLDKSIALSWWSRREGRMLGYCR